MRTIFKIIGLFIISSVLLLTSCDEKYDYSYTGDEFIQFNTASTIITESSTDTLVIPVLIAGKLPTSDITVTLTIEAVAAKTGYTCVQGVDFDVFGIDGTTLTIGANTAGSSFKVVVYDNTVSDSSKTVTFTLTDSNGDYVMGLPGSESKKAFVVNINDDDCPFVAENWVGTPSGIETYSNWPTFTAAAEWSIAEVISPVQVKYLVTGLMNGIFADWEETITNGGEFYITLDYTDPLTPTVVLEAKFPSPEGFDDYGYFATTEDTWSYYIIQDPLYPSTFSTCNKSITIHYLVDISTDGGALDHNFRTCLYQVTFE